MVPRSAFWLILTALAIVAPLPASAASWAYAGGSVGFGADPKPCADLAAASASCDRENSVTDPQTGETKSGSVSAGADWTSGDMFVHAESEASRPDAQATGETQLGDTLSFAGAISTNSTATIRMTGSMSGDSNGGNSDSFSSAWMLIDNLTVGGVCSSQNSAFICDAKNDETDVTVVGNSFFITSTVNIDLHPQVMVEFVLYASTFLTGSADITDPITIDLPQGVTYTSASGLFLTKVGSVPEPSTWAMMLLGFAGLGYAGYRRAKPAVTRI